MYGGYSYNGTGYNGIYNAGAPVHYNYTHVDTNSYKEEDIYSDELKEHIKLNKKAKEENEQNKKKVVSPEGKQI